MGGFNIIKAGGGSARWSKNRAPIKRVQPRRRNASVSPSRELPSAMAHLVSRFLGRSGGSINRPGRWRRRLTAAVQPVTDSKICISNEPLREDKEFPANVFVN